MHFKLAEIETYITENSTTNNMDEDTKTEGVINMQIVKYDEIVLILHNCCTFYFIFLFVVICISIFMF